MASGDIIYDKIHFRHDPKWSRRLGQANGSGLLLCVACVIEMIENEDVASVRKSFVLSGVSGVLKSFPGALRELLQQDQQVSLHLSASLLGMLHTVEDQDTLEKVDQVLVQLLLELQSEPSLCFILDQIHTQLSDQLQLSVKCFLPTFNFLGSLVEAVPEVAHRLVTQYAPVLEHLCSALLYPDEGLKASVLYVWLKLFGAAGGSAAQSMPCTIRDRVCILLLQTLASASSSQLINNCVGLLWLLVQRGDAVSLLMNSPSNQVMCSQIQNSHINNSPNQEQHSPDRCPLPLILKKLLLSGDEMLQMTSAKCVAAILLHSPCQWSAPFIAADVPEFLFDRLAGSSSDVLLWSVYSCLVLLTEDPLFFTHCHSVYGIESLVRSLKEALRLTNLEVPRQGLLLLTEILERQPASVRLFPSGPGFVAVSEALVAGVSSPCLLVARQAAKAASALFRLNHQSCPVQYGEIEGLIEAVTNRLSELPLPSPAHWRSSRILKRSDPSSEASKPERFLLPALICFRAACRLAEECASDPLLKENTFTGPSKQQHAQNSLDSLRQCLLRCCDSVWIPAVVVRKICECAPNAQVLQYFYSILSAQFTLSPSLMRVFANKLASSGFYRLALEHKGLLCAGNRNPNLNMSSCGFLRKLSVCLLSHSDFGCDGYQHDVEEVENLLLNNLPSLCFRLSDWPSLLCEAQGLQLCEYKGPRATQYCLVIMLHLALQHGDRLLPDQTMFSSVLWLLCSVQEQGSCSLPRSVLRSALYLLAVTQDKSPDLDGVRCDCISKVLSSCQSFSSLYIHHPALLHFICRYPELAEKFGPLVLELWLTKPAQHSGTEQTTAERKGDKKGNPARESQDQEPDTEAKELLNLIEKHPAVILTLLDMVCTRETALAEQALAVLEMLLLGQRDYEADLCHNLRPVLLQALQRLNMESVGQGSSAQPVNSLPLVLKLLCVTLAGDPPSSASYSKMDGVHFKLLYHVSNIAGRLRPMDTGSLLPALSYLYCCLTLSSAHCTDGAVTMLLSNSGLMDQLQSVLSSSSSSAPSACPPSALLCCSHLLLSSLITLQRTHSAQVHKRISWSLDTAVQKLLIQKRSTDNLLLVSYLRLLQALLDVDLASAVVCVNSGPGLVGPKPLGGEDGALYPLGSRGAQCLSTALSGLLLQKHELLLRSSVNCLSSLLAFLRRKSHTTEYVVCQPWSRFLLSCLLSSGEGFLLHPAVLRVVTLLLQHGSTAVLWDPHLLQVMEVAERKGLKELSEEAAQALRLLLTQIHHGVLQPTPTEQHRQRAKSLMESLDLQRPAQNCGPPLPRCVLYPSPDVKHTLNCTEHTHCLCLPR